MRIVCAARLNVCEESMFHTSISEAWLTKTVLRHIYDDIYDRSGCKLRLFVWCVESCWLFFTDSLANQT